jgi:hypothetical protein
MVLERPASLKITGISALLDIETNINLLINPSQSHNKRFSESTPYAPTPTLTSPDRDRSLRPH